VPAAVRAQVVTLMTTYAGFNDVHLTEKLQQDDALPVSRAAARPSTAAGARALPRWANSLRLTRAPSRGSRIVGPTAALHGLIDDATSIPLALWVRPTEDLHGYTTVLGQTCRQYGIPVTLYGDRLNLFRRNDRYLGEELRLLFDGEGSKKTTSITLLWSGWYLRRKEL
jgi:hypothetical protein